MEVLYCNQQIRIPVSLPGILKNYTKSAIRTEPSDLLVWSVAYFRSMAKGETPPVKERMENVDSCTATEGLTVGLLQILNKQFANKDTVSMNEVKEKWKGICMKENVIDKLYQRTNWDSSEDVEWKQMLPILCTLVGKDMNENMTIVCQVLSKELPGCEPYLKWEEFWDAYNLLAEYDGTIDDTSVENVRNYLTPIAMSNDNQIGPQDFNNKKCPPLY